MELLLATMDDYAVICNYLQEEADTNGSRYPKKELYGNAKMLIEEESMWKLVDNDTIVAFMGWEQDANVVSTFYVAQGYRRNRELWILLGSKFVERFGNLDKVKYYPINNKVVHSTDIANIKRFLNGWI